VSGASFPTWLVETDVMAARGQPVLSLASRAFVSEHEPIIGELWNTGHAALLAYVRQQVQQFRTPGEDFAMQHTDTQYRRQLDEELQAVVLQGLPVEKRLQGLSPDQVLRQFTAEERMQGLAPKDIVPQRTAQ